MIALSAAVVATDFAWANSANVRAGPWIVCFDKHASMVDYGAVAHAAPSIEASSQASAISCSRVASGSRLNSASSSPNGTRS